MQSAVNIMLVDTDAELSSELEGATAHVVTVANFDEATSALEEFDFEYAIINKATSVFDLAAIGFALRQADVFIIYAAGWAAQMVSTLRRPVASSDKKAGRLN